MEFNSDRYEQMQYKRCGNSGLKLPRVSLGLWHNFGGVDSYENARNLVTTAFNHGITHFDLANNYGPPAGSAEETMGRILRTDLLGHRDELIISSKAGYHMWNGPYGDGGSKKYLFASLHQSLKRLDLDYVDIFYHHRPDPNTPLDETMEALSLMVKQGKALYVGISNYRAEDAKKAIDILRDLHTPCTIHQPRYSMIDRWIEDELVDVLHKEGVGCIPFSPLGKGLLTNRYLKGIPADSRAASKNSIFLNTDDITDDKRKALIKLNDIAANRDQSLAQMALAWVLNNKVVTSVLIGASKTTQIDDCVGAVNNTTFTNTEKLAIDKYCKLIE